MLLELDDVHVHYGKVAALKGISVTVDEGGEIVTLIGANGAGKTTTLKMISGLRPVSRGSVRFAGQDITGLAGYKRVHLGLCHAPEGRGIFPGMTVLENLDMGTYSKKRDPDTLEQVLTMFPQLAERRKQQGGTLSGGEQQMLAIGRALMASPRLLLLDEPSMGLAPKLVTQIFSIIRQINDQGVTVLLVEQNAAQALTLADRAYVLETGTIVRSAPARELLNDPAVRAAYLGGAVSATGSAGDQTATPER